LGVAVRVWTGEHKVGNAAIDDQHEYIVSLINAVEIAATTGAGASTIDLVLGLLTRHLKLHFVSEEAAMQQAGYPGLEEHAAQHAWCAHQFDRLINAYRAGETELENVLKFLDMWLDSHTFAKDREYAAWASSAASASGTP
jgi:hemerythrin